MATKTITTSVPDSFDQAARAAHPELETATASTVIRVALLVLSGVSVAEAIRRSNEGLQSAGRPVGSKTRR